MIVRDVLPNGLRLVTEMMPQVRSVTIGVWLTRGSRHEGTHLWGIAHFVEHMLFKGTADRTAQDLAQEIDAIGGQFDAFTAKEYASYYIKVLDEHLPLAVDLLADLVLHPAFREEDVAREKRVVLEEIKMVEDTPDDLVHELFTANFWDGHPLGRPILGSKETVDAITSDALRRFFAEAYVAPNLFIAAAGNVEHARVRDLVARAFEELPAAGAPVVDGTPRPHPHVVTRVKDIEQSHVCLGTQAYPQDHPDRYACYVLNTLLGGSMSSRLFQDVRERRGLAYSVFSGLNSYRDAGSLTIYVGCATESVGEVVDLVLQDLRGLKTTPVAEAELRRAKDHLKGSLMLSLENTASRMSHLARQEIYFGRPCTLDETLDGIERVTADDVARVAGELFTDGCLGLTVLGPAPLAEVSPARLSLD
jgi:predicted Zn-dependent peptidase